MTGWRGAPGPYSGIVPGDGPAGGGFAYSLLDYGVTDSVYPGDGFKGGGLVNSTAAAQPGAAGCGGPGPGALIGL